MKLLTIFLVLVFVTGIAYIVYAGDYQDGYKQGYSTGYKQSRDTVLEPLQPLVPLQPLKKLSDPKSDYEYGYIQGYKRAHGEE
jgi:hypothetical protein